MGITRWKIYFWKSTSIILPWPKSKVLQVFVLVWVLKRLNSPQIVRAVGCGGCHGNGAAATWSSHSVRVTGQKREREYNNNFFFFADDDRLQSLRHELHPSLIDQVQISQRSVTEELNFKFVEQMDTIRLTFSRESNSREVTKSIIFFSSSSLSHLSLLLLPGPDSIPASMGCGRLTWVSPSH